MVDPRPVPRLGDDVPYVEGMTVYLFGLPYETNEKHKLEWKYRRWNLGGIALWVLYSTPVRWLESEICRLQRERSAIDSRIAELEGQLADWKGGNHG